MKAGQPSESDIAFGVIVRESIQPELIFSQDIEVWKHFPGTYMGVIHRDTDIPMVLSVIQEDDPGEYQCWQVSEIEDQKWVTFIKG